MSPLNTLTTILHEGWGERTHLIYIYSQHITTTCNILLQESTCIMITSILEYMLHYQLEYLEEQNYLKIYNKNIKKKNLSNPRLTMTTHRRLRVESESDKRPGDTNMSSVRCRWGLGCRSPPKRGKVSSHCYQLGVNHSSTYSPRGIRVAQIYASHKQCIRVN